MDDMILYHGTNDADGVMKNGIRPSSDEVPAGASGVYLSTSPKSSRMYGDVLRVEVPDNLKLHPDITQHPELELTRRRNQYAKEGPEGDEWYTAEEKTGRAADVSEDLAKKGYDGHYDSMVEHGDVVIFDPAHIKVLGRVNPKLNGSQFK